MFHQVKIYDKENILKKVISPAQVSKLHWEREGVVPIGGKTANYKYEDVPCANMHCKNLFMRTTRQQKYCGDKKCANIIHYEKNKVPHTEKICRNIKCGKKFIADGNRKYCWDPCESPNNIELHSKIPKDL